MYLTYLNAVSINNTVKFSNSDTHTIYEKYAKECSIIGEVSTITTDLAQAATARAAAFAPAPGISNKQSDQNFYSNIISSGKSKKQLQKDVNNFKKLVDLTKDVQLSDDIKNKVDKARNLLIQYKALYNIIPN